MKVLHYIHRGFIWLMILPIKFYKYSISPLVAQQLPAYTHLFGICD